MESGERPELIKLTDYYPSPGSSNEHAYLYTAMCEEKVLEIHFEPLKYIRKIFVTETVMDDMVKSGKIKHGRALLSWFYYKSKKDL